MLSICHTDIKPDTTRYLAILHEHRCLRFELTHAQYDVFSRVHQRLLSHGTIEELDIAVIEHTARQELGSENLDILMTLLTTTLSVQINNGTLSSVSETDKVALVLALPA